MDNDVLQEFVGRKVRVEAVERVFKSEYSGEHKYTDYTIADDDETMRDLKVETAKANLDVRVWLPNTMGTCDYRMGRLNVRVEKDADGEFGIARVYRG
jgi:hypothetical protein